ncbi:hypothetical protein PAHAL_7G062700 [Panicum hallii]|uniref:Uncharacterized protein n=1 Tax=Panicum hallii TaxID=206008 RepID=A0A2S3I609_9POAL|nr:hypothetical protein PAHAL_7G062700 [Panicum hallii]
MLSSPAHRDYPPHYAAPRHSDSYVASSAPPSAATLGLCLLRRFSPSRRPPPLQLLRRRAAGARAAHALGTPSAAASMHTLCPKQRADLSTATPQVHVAILTEPRRPPCRRHQVQSSTRRSVHHLHACCVRNDACTSSLRRLGLTSSCPTERPPPRSRPYHVRITPRARRRELTCPLLPCQFTDDSGSERSLSLIPEHGRLRPHPASPLRVATAGLAGTGARGRLRPPLRGAGASPDCSPSIQKLFIAQHWQLMQPVHHM